MSVSLILTKVVKSSWKETGTKMPPLTTSRIRLSLQQKQKIIEESKKPGFKREKNINEYGINR